MAKKIMIYAVISLVTVTCVITSFLYINTFRVNNLSGYKPPENNFVIYNYREYKLEKKSFSKTTIVGGKVEIDYDTAVKSVSVQSTQLVEDSVVKKGSIIGLDGSDQEIKSDLNGRILAVAKTDAGINLSILDYDNVFFAAEIENKMGGYLKMNQDYSAVAASNGVVLNLYSLGFDILSGVFQCRFRLSNFDFSDIIHFFNGMEIRLDLFAKQYSMTCIDKAAVSHADFKEETDILLIVKDNQGKFRQELVKCVVIADAYIGLNYANFDSGKDVGICFLVD